MPKPEPARRFTRMTFEERPEGAELAMRYATRLPGRSQAAPLHVS